MYWFFLHVTLQSWSCTSPSSPCCWLAVSQEWALVGATGDCWALRVSLDMTAQRGFRDTMTPPYRLRALCGAIELFVQA